MQIFDTWAGELDLASYRDFEWPATQLLISELAAGDTPVITLTHVVVPGLGTFTSRVMVYGDRYAGTWQHDKVGGHLWGHIEHGTTPAPKATDTK